MKRTQTVKQCRAHIGLKRCEHRGTQEQLKDHAIEAGHPLCAICNQARNRYEPQVCRSCAENTRDDLTAIDVAYTHLERRIDEGAYSGGWLTALSMLSDGAVDGGGEDDDVKYHDLWPVVAVLEQHDRDWREEFNHPSPVYKPLGHPDRILRSVLNDCLTYLRDWHWEAAKEHPDFDAYALSLRMLRSQIEHVVGLADDPEVAPIPCDCSGRLERRYADNGREEVWTCRKCKREYDRDDYARRLVILTYVPGWISVDQAARHVDRPRATVWAWVRAGDVAVSCSRITRRVMVELSTVEARSELAGRVTRKAG